MHKTLRVRVYLKMAELQLPLLDNFTCEFLDGEDNSRDLLENHWQDKIVPERAKKRLLQSISYNFHTALSD